MSVSVGQAAKLIQPVVQGEVTDTRYNKEAGQLEHQLEYTDAAGESHTRWFLESQLEAVANAE